MTVAKVMLVIAVFVVAVFSLTEAAALPHQVISDNIPVQVVYDETQEKAYQRTLEGKKPLQPQLEEKFFNDIGIPSKIKIIIPTVEQNIKPLVLPKVEIIEAISIQLDVEQEEAVKKSVLSPEVVKAVEEIILPEMVKVEKIVVPNVDVESILDDEQKQLIPNSSQLKNNDEKVQLNNEELIESAKHILINEAVKTKIVTPDIETVTVNNGNRAPSYHELSEEYYNRVQQVVQNGINNIKADVKAYETKSGEQIKPEILEQLEKTASEYLKFVRSKVDLKAATLNHQEIVDTFQSNSEAFLKKVQIIGKQDAAVTPTPTQPDNQNGFQNFINIIYNGFQNITNNLGGNQSSAGQGDEGTGSQNPFQLFLSTFSNYVGGGTQQSGTQGDESTGTQAPNLFVQAISSIQTGFSNLIGQGANNAATPATAIQGDENPAPAPVQPSNPLVQAFNNIQTGISNFGANLVGQGTPAPAAVPADEGTPTQTPPNPFSQVITNIQSGISTFGSNLGIGQSPANTGSTPTQGDEQPVTPQNGFQQFISNIGTGFSQILPFGQQQQQQQSTGNTQADTVTPSAGPVNPVPSIPNIPGIPQNPQVQGIVNQVSQAISSPSQAVQGGPGAISEQAQNAFGQASQQFGGFNPVNVQGGPGGAGSVQNIINQVSSGFNTQAPVAQTQAPVSQGDETSSAITAVNPANFITPPSNVVSQIQSFGSQAGQTLGGIFSGNPGNIQNLNPSGGLQNIQTEFGQLVNQGISPSTPPPASSTVSAVPQDEAATTASSVAVPSNIPDFIGQGSQLFGQGSNAAQSVASQISNAGSSGGSSNQVQSIVQNFISQGQQIANLGSTTSATTSIISTVAVSSQGDEATANPLPIPGAPPFPSLPGTQLPQFPAGAQLPTLPGIGTNNSPLQQLQGVILQGSQNAGNIVQGSNNPQQLFESASSQLNPTNQVGGSSTGGIQQAVQSVQSQVVSQINQGSGQQSIFSPQGIQTSVNQAASAVTPPTSATFPTNDGVKALDGPLQALVETVAKMNPFRRKEPEVVEQNKDMTIEAQNKVVSNIDLDDPKKGIIDDLLQSITNFLNNPFGGNKPVQAANPETSKNTEE